MSYLRQFENVEQIVSTTGMLYGRQAFVLCVIGRRAGFTSTTVLNDIKEFDNAVAETPELANTTLDVVSSSAADAVAGTGVRQVKVTYLNNLNVLTESPPINLNGTTPVVGALAGVNYVLWMETVTAGSGQRAAGNIRLRITGGVVEVEQITAQNNTSFTAQFMVPAGFTAYVPVWRTHAINNDQHVRLQAQVFSLTRTLATIYTTQANSDVALNTNSSPLFLPYLRFPPLCRMKCSTLSAGTAASVQCDVSFNVVLVAD